MSKYAGSGCRIRGVWSLFYAASTSLRAPAFHPKSSRCTRANPDPKSRCLRWTPLLLSVMAGPAWLCLDGYLRCISYSQSPPTVHYAATVDSIFKRSFWHCSLFRSLSFFHSFSHTHTYTRMHAHTSKRPYCLVSTSFFVTNSQPSPSTSSDRLLRTWLLWSNLYRKTQSKPFRMFSNDVSIPIE